MEEIITVESEYEQLKTKLRMLRAEVSALTARRDELLLRECPRIKAEYDARIGAMELRVFYAQNKLYELKRAIEILQAARNRQEEKSSDEAAEQAHEEYEAYEEDLKQKAEDIKNSGAYREREEEEDRRWRTGPNDAAEDGIGSEGGTEDSEPKRSRTSERMQERIREPEKIKTRKKELMGEEMKRQPIRMRRTGRRRNFHPARRNFGTTIVCWSNDYIRTPTRIRRRKRPSCCGRPWGRTRTGILIS